MENRSQEDAVRAMLAARAEALRLERGVAAIAAQLGTLEVDAGSGSPLRGILKSNRQPPPQRESAAYPEEHAVNYHVVSGYLL